ncbi:hypothetical protein Z043-121859 [Arapaima gigas]
MQLQADQYMAVQQCDLPPPAPKVGTCLRQQQGKEKGGSTFMHCPSGAHLHLQVWHHVWCKQCNELCCSGVAFSNDTQQLQGGAVTMRQVPPGTFTLIIWNLSQGEGTYWCGLLDTSGAIIKLVESYLGSPGERTAPPPSVPPPPQSQGHLWNLLHWVLAPLLPPVGRLHPLASAWLLPGCVHSHC